MTIISNLPEDMVTEILSRVPTVNLARLRLTSKAWNSMIKDGTLLAKLHAKNYTPSHPSLPLVLIDFRVYLLRLNLHNVNVTCQLSLKDPRDSLKEVNIRDVFHCDGLLLCTTLDRRLVIWNPCSGATRWVQARNSYKIADAFALGYDHKSSTYKILRTDPFSDAQFTEYEIYDFTSDLWRFVGTTSIRFTGRPRGISVNGNTYWLVFSYLRNTEDKSPLVSFDFPTERFGNVSLPKFDHYLLALSVTGQGKQQQLCLLTSRGYDAYLWVATKSETTGEMSWSKFLIEHGFDPCFRFQFRPGMSFLANQEEQVVVSCNRPSTHSDNIIHIVGRVNTQSWIIMVQNLQKNLLHHFSSDMFQVWLKSKEIVASLCMICNSHNSMCLSLSNLLTFCKIHALLKLIIVC